MKTFEPSLALLANVMSLAKLCFFTVRAGFFGCAGFTFSSSYPGTNFGFLFVCGFVVVF